MNRPFSFLNYEVSVWRLLYDEIKKENLFLDSLFRAPGLPDFKEGGWDFLPERPMV